MSGRSAVREWFAAAVAASDPYRAVLAHAVRVDERLAAASGRMAVIGFGKAACPMARALEDRFGRAVDDGIVITKYGHAGFAPPDRIRVVEAGHPVPDAEGVRGAESIIGLVRANRDALIVCLVSGGGSALFVSPADGISLTEKQAVTDLLLRAGADIGELNTVRKHLSRVKGGRIAQMLGRGRLLSLILSDVIGDPLDVIASGPTSPDPTTYADALRVLERHDLLERTPASVRLILSRGAAGDLPETPKAGDPVFASVNNVIVGSNRLALQAVRRKAEAAGWETRILSETLTGEARAVGETLAREALRIRGEIPGNGRRRICLVAGGETTVTVRGTGRGGRSQEMALSFAMAVDGADGITFLAAGTDGTDGPTDAAGAIVDGETLARARRAGLDAASCLAANDAYPFLQQTGDLLITGPTGTNVMDIQIVLIETGGDGR